MSFDLETYPAEREAAFEHRYDAINVANQKSYYLNDPNRTFDAFQSLHSYGEARIINNPSSEEEASLTRRAAFRLMAGGNMSTLGPYGPAELSEAERIQDAKNNMETFFHSLDIPKTSVYMLNPERDYSTPLTLVDVDKQTFDESTQWPARLGTSGDFIYSRDPNKVLAVRPADCPVMIATGDTAEGKVHMLVHYAWKGAANHYVQQTAQAFDSLGVDRDSLEIYLSPGAQSENYVYAGYSKDPREEFPDTDGLFTKVTSHEKKDGTTVWDFGIDTPKYVYDQVLKYVVTDPKQVFCDTTDTGSLQSGYSSHSRSNRLKPQGESNTRDIVVAVFNQ